MYFCVEVADRPIFFIFFWSVKLVCKMAVHESGDWERRAIGPLLGSGEGVLKQKAAPGFHGKSRYQLFHHLGGCGCANSP